jgi:two-component system KDP operon response regulator KdpE
VIARILIVDDDEAIRATLTQHLMANGYDVVSAKDGVEAMEQFASLHPDLVLTDLAMPRADGFTVIQGIRAASDTPVLVLSVRGGDADKVRALDLGADDFVVKPFSAVELLARVRAQLRRSGNALHTLFEFPDLTIDLERRKVTQGGRDVRLTPTEFAILEILARHAGRPVSFDELIASVWKGAPATSNDAVRVHVGALRRKLEPDPSNPRYLVTEPWIGYRFIAEPIG